MEYVQKNMAVWPAVLVITDWQLGTIQVCGLEVGGQWWYMILMK